MVSNNVPHPELDADDDDPVLEQRVVSLGAIKVLSAPIDTTRASTSTSTLPTKALVDIGGEHCRVSHRFWKSIFNRYRFGSSTFRYFHPQEVFKRICEVSPQDTLRVVVERHEGKPPTALGVSRPDQPIVTIEDVERLAGEHGATSVGYGGGLMHCTFIPRSGEKTTAIGADQFANRFVLDVPVDGFGTPHIHLALYRLLCSNGLVGYHKAFCSEVPGSRDPRHTLERAIECFDHGDGYAALRDRFLSAQTSWASVREAHTLYRQVAKSEAISGANKTRALESLDRLTGRMHELYGVTNMESLPARRQRLLPVKCRTYDLLNFAGEVATHCAEPAKAGPIQAWIGATLADEFDLEGTAEHVPEFADLFVKGKAT